MTNTCCDTRSILGGPQIWHLKPNWTKVRQMGWKGGFIRCQLDVEFHGASKFDKPFFFIFSGWKVMATKIWGIFCFLQRGGVPNLAPYQKRASGWNWNPSEESIWCRISWGFYIFWFQKPISHRSKVMDTQLLVAKRQCKQRHNNLGYACPN